MHILIQSLLHPLIPKEAAIDSTRYIQYSTLCMGWPARLLAYKHTNYRPYIHSGAKFSVWQWFSYHSDTTGIPVFLTTISSSFLHFHVSPFPISSFPVPLFITPPSVCIYHCFSGTLRMRGLPRSAQGGSVHAMATMGELPAVQCHNARWTNLAIHCRCNISLSTD